MGHSQDCFCSECRGDEPIPAPECMGTVYCQHCKKRFGYCSDVTKKEEEEKMINRNAATPSAKGAATGRGGRRANQGIPFLKQENVNFDKRSANILATRIEDDNLKEGGQVCILKIAFAGNTYLWTLRPGNPNLDILCDTWGEDEQQWVGKNFLLFLETDEFTNKNWFRAEIAKERKPASK